MCKKHAERLCAYVSFMLFASAMPGMAASANFLPLDRTTVGNWVGVYGHDGYIIANDAKIVPSYGTVTSTATPYTWVFPSTDPLALLTAPGSSARIASTFYTSSSLSFDINLTDGNTHQLALYLLDLDTTTRVETISILDAATNTVLDSRTLSSFQGGVYAIWTVQGHVIAQVTYVSGLNAVVGALFFDPAAGSGTSTPPPTVSLSNPAGGTVSGSVTVSANASSTAGIASVQFQLDGTNLGSAVAGAGPLYSTTWNTATASNASHTLTAIATDALNQSTTSTPVTVTVSNTSGTGPSATLVSTDLTTEGNWKGVYGSSGYVIANDSNNPPGYATLNLNGAPAYTWVTSTTDPRALTKGASTTDRIASTYYSSSSITMDLNLTDSQSHTVALYFVDYDRQSRSQTITIVDASTNAVLDGPRTLINFSGGEYFVWNLQGHVQIRVTNTGNLNAVVSGLFFGNSGTAPANTPPTVSMTSPAGGTVSGTITISAAAAATTAGASMSSVQFQLDGVNLGPEVAGTGPLFSMSWNTATASNAGHTLAAIATDSLNLHALSAAVPVTVSNFTAPPPPPTVSLSSPVSGTVSGSVTVSANASSTAGIASVQFQLDGANLGSAVTGSGPYSTAWDTTKASNASHTLTAIATDILNQSTTSAAVTVTVSNNASTGPSATFVSTDTTTEGNWKGVYGSTGYVIANDSNNPPAYATLNLNGAPAYTWVTSTTDPRALTKGASTTDRIASTYYSSSSVTMDLNLTDNQTHTVALYCVDYDSESRSQTITIVNAGTNAVLDGPRTVADFTGGEYFVWNLQGHVQILVTNTGNLNAVVSGLFFGNSETGPAGTPPTVSMTSPAGGTVSGTVTVSATAAATTAGATIGSVQFQLDGANLGAAVSGSGPYSIFWNTAAASNGSHALTAVATDSLNQKTTSAGVSVTVSNSAPPPPTVSLTSPSGGTVSGSVMVSANASSTAGIASVQFQLDGVNLGAAVTGSGPYSTAWDTTKASNASHTLTAIATDILNQSTTSAAVAVTVGNNVSAGPSATFVTTDTATQGNWMGIYGQDGHVIALDSNSPPSYASWNFTGAAQYLWSSTTSDPRSLQQGNSTGLIASAFYAAPSFTMDLNSTDGQFHELALYFLDWDYEGRAETVTILDPNTQTVLDTRTVSSFYYGKYLVWNVKGHVTVQFIFTAGKNAVVSGVFLSTPGNLNPNTPTLSVSNTSLTFQGAAGASNPAGQSVNITNTGLGTLNWTAAKTQPWLTLSAPSGTAPSSLGLSASISGLSAGTYKDTVTISGTGATGSPQTVSVTLVVLPGPNLTLSATGMNPSGTALGPNPAAQTVTITNTGGGTLNWTAAKNQSWITLSAASGTAPSSLLVSFVTTGLVAGTYSDTIAITASGAASSPQTIAITLTLTAPVTPVGNWTFDTGTISGTTVLDTSGDGINGTIIGGVTSVPGAVGQALSFDGSTGYVLTSPDPRPAMRNDMTITAWIRTTNWSRTETVVSDYNTSGNEDGYMLETTAAGFIGMHLGGNNIQGARDIIDGTNPINNGQWHHVAAIIRPNQDISFYVDGGLSSVYYLSTSYSSSINPVGLGGPATTTDNLFTGSMDEVRIYARALSSSEIAGIYGGTVTTVPGGQVLYNGITMPKNFPPPTTATQMYRTPYYINNPPLVLPINVGRQLFVDDFLIAQTTMQRTQHQPTILPINPVLTPGAPISAGAWYSPAKQLYEMWYYNTTNDYRYTYSNDGMNWTLPTYPDVLVPNTNEVVPGGDTIWLDQQETNPSRRYKSFQVDSGALKVYMYFSADGIHWGPRQNFNINTLSDRTTFFWNPFRNVWVNSDRNSTGVPATPNRAAYNPRVRFYSESKDLMTWTPSDPSQSFMTGPDDQDPPYYLNNPGGEPPELYNMDAVAYESVMVGLFSWFYPGYPYSNYTLAGPTLVELGVGFSRDGFSWVRPTRGSGPNPGGAFIPASNIAGTWNAYNTQSVGGGFLVVGDKLYFYFSARTLQKPLDGVFSTGLAELRRDGFYSMDAGATEATLTTRVVNFTGNHLFVNVSAPSGQLLVEVLDHNGNVIPGFSKSNSVQLSLDKTSQEVTWNGANLTSLAGQNVQFKFYLTNGELYSFWVTPSAQGASYGYVAAGGPGFTGVTDTVGSAGQ